MQSACDTRSFAANTYLLVRASSKPDARRWSLTVLRGQQCSGPFEEQTRSWLSAAAISMASLKITGRHVARLKFHCKSHTQKHCAKSMCGIVEFLHPVPVFQDFARLGAVRRADDAVFLHQIDEARGAAITDAQPPLQRGSGSPACVANHADRVLVESVVNVFATLGIAIVRAFGLGVFILRCFEQFFLIFCLRLLAPEVAYRSDFILSDQRPMNAMEPR